MFEGDAGRCTMETKEELGCFGTPPIRAVLTNESAVFAAIHPQGPPHQHSAAQHTTDIATSCHRTWSLTFEGAPLNVCGARRLHPDSTCHTRMRSPASVDSASGLSLIAASIASMSIFWFKSARTHPRSSRLTSTRSSDLRFD
jgi:hypothetical protein